jgi:glyoxylase-like metal-dependent hydrolase (beta-lactamase superfamily II)
MAGMSGGNGTKILVRARKGRIVAGICAANADCSGRSGRVTICSVTSLVLLATRGHTPGSMSLLVRRPGRPTLMMVGDVTYDADLLKLGHVPRVGSWHGLRDSTAMISTMRQRDPGLVILPARDPAAASRLAQATGLAPTLTTVLP